jgi:hypothetical protein
LLQARKTEIKRRFSDVIESVHVAASGYQQLDDFLYSLFGLIVGFVEKFMQIIVAACLFLVEDQSVFDISPIGNFLIFDGIQKSSYIPVAQRLNGEMKRKKTFTVFLLVIDRQHLLL